MSSLLTPHRLLLATALVALAASAAQPAELDVTVLGVAPNQGTVLVGLFDASRTFDDKPLAYATAQPSAGQVTVKFGALPPGDYAVSAFQDTNGNHRLDRGRFGIPVEKYGFSRDAHGNYGPPDFGDAAIRLGTSTTAVRLTLE